ncbi:MAG: fasciclin domain-containing protein [Chloroflexi bacterium]|nr:fasciclin domain-containing protein [Chloroflexota bacterium]
MADLLETARAAGSFSTLVAIAHASGLVDQLKGAGPFTLFAPVDDAFADLPDAKLERLLQGRPPLGHVLANHLMEGSYRLEDVVGLGSARMLHGKRVTIDALDGRLVVDGALVVESDIVADNGVLHAIDRVLLPEVA